MSKIFQSWKALEYACPDIINYSLMNRDDERDVYNHIFGDNDIILWCSDVGWKSFKIPSVNNLSRNMDIAYYPLYHHHSRNYFFKNTIDLKNMYKLKERY
jgi:hypothetical protein